MAHPRTDAERIAACEEMALGLSTRRPIVYYVTDGGWNVITVGPYVGPYDVIRAAYQNGAKMDAAQIAEARA